MQIITSAIPYLFSSTLGELIPAAQDPGFVGSLALDGLGLFVLLASVVVAIVGLWAYISRPGLVVYTTLALLLIITVFLLVTATNLVLFYVMWEIVTFVTWGLRRRTSVHSYPTLGPLPVQGVGGIGTMCMLSAITLLAVENRTLELGPLPTSLLTPITVLILAAVYLKSYGVIVQTWLAGEPRSAGVANGLLASAGLVAIGFYPYVRLFWTALGAQPTWRDTALPISLAIAVIAAVIALGERDTNRLLSYGAFSQLAWFLTAAALLGPSQAGALFLAYLTVSLAFAGLFMTLGLAERIAGERDTRNLGGLIRVAPIVAALFALLTLAAVGLPPFGAFTGRVSVELPLLASGEASIALVMFGVTLLTLLYLTRLFGLVFLGELRHPIEEVRAASEHFAVSILVVVLLFIGLASPLFMSLMQSSFSIPTG